jgi:hypothetical protein
MPLEVRNKSQIRSSHLREHIGEIVSRIALHLARHRRLLRHRRSSQVRVRSWMCNVHSIDARHPAKHPVKRIVLQHQNNNVLDLHPLSQAQACHVLINCLGAGKQKRARDAVSFRNPYTIGHPGFTVSSAVRWTEPQAL